jgi:hypothetical protein
MDLTTEQQEYRKRLVAGKKKSEEDLDKALIALSGGALAVSITFVKTLISDHAQRLAFLLGAWGLWLISLALVVLSFYISIEAHRTAVKGFDENPDGTERLGGHWDKMTRSFRPISLITFLFGIISIAIFSFINLKGNQSWQSTMDQNQTPNQCQNQHRHREYHHHQGAHQREREQK